MAKYLKSFTPLALLLALVLVISGCSAGQQVTAADIVAKMRETMKTTQTSQGVVDVSLTLNKDGIKALAQTFMPAQGTGGTTTANGKDWSSQLPDAVSGTIKTWKQAPDKVAVEIAKSTVPGTSGVKAAYDGTKFGAYVPSNNTFYTGTPSNMDQIPAEVQSMLQNPDVQKQFDQLIAASDIKLAGNEKVAGIDTYKLDITPKADAAQTLGLPQAFQTQAGVLIKDLHITLWVDQQRWVPLKVDVQHPNIGEFTETTTQMDLNKPIDASQFSMTAPSGAKTVDLDALKSQMTPKVTTLQAASDTATKEGWKLLEPGYVTANATLVDVKQLPATADKQSTTPSTGSVFMLGYSAQGVNFSIVEGRSQHQPALGEGMLSGVPTTGTGSVKQVTVRGVTGTAFAPGDGSWSALAWQEKGTSVWVSVYGNIKLDEATKIAESLK